MERDLAPNAKVSRPKLTCRRKTQSNKAPSLNKYLGKSNVNQKLTIQKHWAKKTQNEDKKKKKKRKQKQKT